jgi:glucose/arabinose dehydrogenase
MYGLDNGGDAKGDNWPPEELNQIRMDKDYGWPLVYGKREVDQTREEPMGTTKEAYAKTTEPSLLEFPAHSAPMMFKFLHSAESLPNSLKDDALVCWHGSWNRKDPDGFKVQLIRFENGKPVKAEDFLTGFYNPGTRSRFGRPFGLAVATDGAIYISDDANGILYCVTPSR